MDNMQRKSVSSLLLAIIPGVLFVLGAGVFFLPLIGVRLSDGSLLSFPSVTMIFGGEATVAHGGSLYSFVFSLNLYAIGTLQLLLLASFASFLSRGRKSNKVLALILGALGIVGFSMQILFLTLASPSIEKSGLEYTGFFVMGIAFLALACALDLIALLKKD